VATWPAVALIGSYELLTMNIHGAQVSPAVTALAGLSGRPPDPDPIWVQAAQMFADDLAAGCVPQSAHDPCAASCRTVAWAAGTGVPRLAADSLPRRRLSVHRQTECPRQQKKVDHGMWSASEDSRQRSARMHCSSHLRINLLLSLKEKCGIKVQSARTG
jgi:hypothetical protein